MVGMVPHCQDTSPRVYKFCILDRKVKKEEILGLGLYGEESATRAIFFVQSAIFFMYISLVQENGRESLLPAPENANQSSRH